MSQWKAEELSVLKRLREGFLNGSAGQADYWDRPETLELYDRTFGRRIGWKWEAVLAELTLRGWRPEEGRLVDLGCGTGVATRRFLEQWPEWMGEVVLMDRSVQARVYASEGVRAMGFRGSIRMVAPGEADCRGAIVLLSHVLTELNDSVLSQWRRALEGAAAFVWVESATHPASRRLVEEVREPLLNAGAGWRVLGPCAHSAGCPLSRPEHGAHWCHHFARVPSEAHQDAGLAELCRALNVDLRVLPYSFLAMRRAGEAGAGGLEKVGARVLGRPEEMKGHFRLLCCEAEGLFQRVLQKRDQPEEYRRLRKEPGLMLYRLESEGARILKAQRCVLGEEQSSEGVAECEPESERE